MTNFALAPCSRPCGALTRAAGLRVTRHSCGNGQGPLVSNRDREDLEGGPSAAAHAASS